MMLPKGTTYMGSMYVWVYNAIYGLPNAGHHWNINSHKAILLSEPRFTQSVANPCLFFIIEKDLMVFLCTNVDDYGMFSSDPDWHVGFLKNFNKFMK